MNARWDMVTVFVARPDPSGVSHEFLQLLRSRDRYMGGTWQVVRGGIEPGETAVDAALRELREETALAPKEFYRLGNVESFHTIVDDTLWHSAAFCAIVGREQEVCLNPEHDDYRWMPCERIDAQTMWASERSVLRDLQRDVLDGDDGGLAKRHLRVDVPRP